MEIATVEITALAFGGEGVARLEDGAVVFVPFTAPGDRASIRIVSRRKNFCKGELVQLLNENPLRVAPVCKHFGRCGGCQYQHITPEAEMEWKKTQLLDCMRRIGGIKDPNLKLDFAYNSPLQYGYRNKLRLEASEAGRRDNQSSYASYGYCLNDNKTFFTVHECPLAEKVLNDSISKAVRSEWGKQNAKRKPAPAPMTLRVTADGQVHYYFGFAPKNVSWLKESICGKDFSVPLGSFWQVNRQVASIMLNTVSNIIDEFTDAEYLIDAYSGVGTFSVCIKKNFVERCLIESDKQAAEAAKLNHAENALGCLVIGETTEKGLPSALKQFEMNKTVLVLDPPRTGCEPIVLKRILKAKPKYVVYVSCNPSTLARDVKELTANGEYAVTKLGMFNMFPRTAHFESAAVLVKL